MRSYNRSSVRAWVGVLLMLFTSTLSLAETWETLAPGLEFGRWPLPHTNAPADSFIAVLRADPSRWQLTALSVTQVEDTTGLSARSWAKKYGMTAVTNAGMYDKDRVTHIGLLVTTENRHNPKIHPRYKSLAVFDSIHETDPPFAILDRETHNFDSAGKRWRGRVQNLRLIRSPGENRWEPGGKRWSEAALGEDDAGRILFIYCPIVMTMYELNEALLSLPIGIVAAQHLEGGVRAQLYMEAGDRIIEFHTGRETNFRVGYEPGEGIVIPNVLGLRSR